MFCLLMSKSPPTADGLAGVLEAVVIPARVWAVLPRNVNVSRVESMKDDRLKKNLVIFCLLMSVAAAVAASAAVVSLARDPLALWSRL